MSRESGDWMGNPSKWLEVMPINRHVWRVLQEELEARKDELRLYLGQELNDRRQAHAEVSTTS